MDDTPVRTGAAAVVTAADGGREYPGLLAAVNADFLMIEVTGRSPTYRPGTAVTLQVGGRGYATSVARLDGNWLTLARPDDLGVGGRGAVRLAATALPVSAKVAGERIDGHVVDVSASGARLTIAPHAAFTVDATLALVYRSTGGTVRVRRVEAADAEQVHLGLTFEGDAVELQRQLIRAMGNIYDA